jgi:hypothetical protein
MFCSFYPPWGSSKRGRWADLKIAKVSSSLKTKDLQIQKQAMAEELVFSSVYSKSEYVNWRNTIFIHE